MLKLSTSKKILSPVISALFILTSVAQSNSALLQTEASVDQIDTAGPVFDLNKPLILNEPIIQIAFGGAATAAISRPLNSAVAECRAGGAAYAASCTAAAYRKAARAASKPDYRDAKRTLNDAAKKLEKLVAKNVDKDAPTKKVKGKKVRAVKKAAIAKVNKEAIKIIKETETKLLRSSGSGTRKVHYQRIAQAVGSTKVIFRS